MCSYYGGQAATQLFDLLLLAIWTLCERVQQVTQKQFSRRRFKRVTYDSVSYA